MQAENKTSSRASALLCEYLRAEVGGETAIDTLRHIGKHMLLPNSVRRECDQDEWRQWVADLCDRLDTFVG